MEFTKIYFSILLLALPSLFGCSSKNEKIAPITSCSDVSVRIMFSLVEDKFDQLLQRSSPVDSANKTELENIISNLRGFNNELIIEGGGFEKGKSLKMINPCQKGENAEKIIKRVKNQELFKKFINTLNLSGLISSQKALNMSFIVDSYFCNENCAFSDSNLDTETIGSLTLQNLILQYALLDLLFLQQ